MNGNKEMEVTNDEVYWGESKELHPEFEAAIAGLESLISLQKKLKRGEETTKLLAARQLLEEVAFPSIYRGWNGRRRGLWGSVQWLIEQFGIRSLARG